MFRAVEFHLLASGVNLVLAVGLVPLGHRRALVHVLDNLPPSDPGVVGTEGDFTELRRIGDDAHFGPPEVVVEKILKPHTGNDAHLPGERPPFEDIVVSAVRRCIPVRPLGGALTPQGEGHVELPQYVDQPQAGRG